jgi:PTH2 family peptidyl-tRNA hydrolase
MDSVKQVIVMRTDLGMGKGKMVAQGAHASIKSLVHKFMEGKTPNDLSSAERKWYGTNFRKICVKVTSEAQLLEIYNKAKEVGLEAHLIEDHGLTVFDGEHTKTCVAIGPDFDDNIDRVTGGLPLL